MAHKTLVGGTAYEVNSGKTLVGGTAYNIAGGKTLVGGTAYDIGFGAPVGDLEVGTSLYFNVNGVSTEFIIVHQGNPDSTMYDSSCDGTWVLMKDIYENGVWDATELNRYSVSDIHTYLNDTFIALLDARAQASIKTVLIPYCSGTGNVNGVVRKGSSGLSTQVFLLSNAEVSYGGAYCSGSINGVANGACASVPADGVCLSYFNSMLNAKKAYLNGVASAWWLRTGSSVNCYDVHFVSGNASIYHSKSNESYGIRPAFILPSNYRV